MHDEETHENKLLPTSKSEIKDEVTLNSSKLPINCPQPSVAVGRLQNITETEEGESQCPYCQYTNISTETVKDHMNVFHERRKWYGCPYCPLNSSCKRTIFHHLKKKHNLSSNDVFLDAIQLSIERNTEESRKVIIECTSTKMLLIANIIPVYLCI